MSEDKTVMNTRARTALLHARKAAGAAGQQVVSASADEEGPDVPHLIAAGDQVLGVARGRTLALDNFESLRVDVEVTTRVPWADGEAAYAQLAAWADEWIQREEASARGTKRMDRAVDDVPGTGRRVELSYGMTLSGAARYEMHRIDVTLGVPVADGVCLEDVARRISDTLGARLADQDRAVRETFPARIAGGGR
jgi:hypothetical protein